MPLSHRDPASSRVRPHPPYADRDRAKSPCAAPKSQRRYARDRDPAPLAELRSLPNAFPPAMPSRPEMHSRPEMGRVRASVEPFAQPLSLRQSIVDWRRIVALTTS